jgi:hypothetical protein
MPVIPNGLRASDGRNTSESGLAHLRAAPGSRFTACELEVAHLRSTATVVRDVRQATCGVCRLTYFGAHSWL